MSKKAQPTAKPLAAQVATAMMLAPIILYRWTLSPLVGAHCRHLPTCSDYAREAIDLNGAWKGGWLTLARLCRCQPWGSHGLDPVLDLTGERHILAPWRYGSWRMTEVSPRKHRHGRVRP